MQLAQQLATGWTVRGSNPSGGEIFHAIHTSPRGPPNHLYSGYLDFPIGKAAEHPLHSTTRLQMSWSYTSTPPPHLRLPLPLHLSVIKKNQKSCTIW